MAESTEETDKEEIKEEDIVEEIKEEDIVEERVYTIPLRRAWVSPRKKRAPRAIHLIKDFVQKHMKPEVLILSNELNERIWNKGIEKPPRRIRVRATRDTEGTVTIYLAEGE